MTKNHKKTPQERMDDEYTKKKNDAEELEEWCKNINLLGDNKAYKDLYDYVYNEKEYCKNDSNNDDSKNHNQSKKGHTEHFTMMNDEKSMNSILVFGLFIVLFSFVYIYGFHGILKFEKNLNYLIAILFSAFGIILSIMLIIGAVRHVSSNTMSDEDKVSSRNGLLVIVVLIIFFSMMAIIRYNYGKLFNALNKALPVNKPSPPRGRGRGKRR
jgi:hypothetical protein